MPAIPDIAVYECRLLGIFLHNPKSDINARIPPIEEYESKTFLGFMSLCTGKLSHNQNQCGILHSVINDTIHFSEITQLSLKSRPKIN